MGRYRSVCFGFSFMTPKGDIVMKVFGEGNTKFFEGDGLQAVHNCFLVHAALAAEGAIFRQPRLFPQPLKIVPYEKSRFP